MSPTSAAPRVPIPSGGETRPVVVVASAGGDPAETAAAIDRTRVPEPGFVIAADSGLELAAELGLAADLVVGDLDSVDPAALAVVEAAGVTVERHPTDKDATDLELALAAAAARQPDEIVVVGGAGGRLDHLLGALLLLAADSLAAIRITALIGRARVHVVRGTNDAVPDEARRDLEIEGRAGELLTLLAVGGPATGVTISGVRYPLSGATLSPGSTLGVSNVLTADRALLGLERGVLFAVLPGELAPAPSATASPDPSGAAP
jgi:thiamine pyrophosphokinase